MAKKKTKKELAAEEVVTPVVETVEETPVVEETTQEVEEQPLTLEQVKALEEATRAAFKALFSKKQ